MFILQLLDCFYGNACKTCQRYQKMCSATYAKPKPILSDCNLQHANFLVTVIYCVVPENVHTPPTEGIGDSGGVGVIKGPNM